MVNFAVKIFNGESVLACCARINTTGEGEVKWSVGSVSISNVNLYSGQGEGFVSLDFRNYGRVNCHRLNAVYIYNVIDSFIKIRNGECVLVYYARINSSVKSKVNRPVSVIGINNVKLQGS